MKRIVSIAISLIMMLTLSATVFADSVSADNFILKVNGSEVLTTDSTVMELGISSSTEFRVVPKTGKANDYTYKWTIRQGYIESNHFDLSYVGGSDNSAVKLTTNSRTLEARDYNLAVTITSNASSVTITFPIKVQDYRYTGASEIRDGYFINSKQRTIDLRSDKYKVIGEVFQAIYNSEEEVTINTTDRVSFVFDGLDMNSVSKSNWDKVINNFYISRRLDREDRRLIEKAAEDNGYGDLVNAKDYFLIDTSAHGNYLGTAKMQFRLGADIDENAKWADKAAAGSVRAYVIDRRTGSIQNYGTASLVDRRGIELELSVDSGRIFIFSDKDLEYKGTSTTPSSKPTSSTPVNSSKPATSSNRPPIPNTSDNNFIAIIAIIGVLALAGGTVVVKKATK